jgi:uncharacterized phage infection (PIP) family protein YhgE
MSSQDKRVARGANESNPQPRAPQSGLSPLAAIPEKLSEMSTTFQYGLTVLDEVRGMLEEAVNAVQSRHDAAAELEQKAQQRDSEISQRELSLQQTQEQLAAGMSDLAEREKAISAQIADVEEKLKAVAAASEAAQQQQQSAQQALDQAHAIEKQLSDERDAIMAQQQAIAERSAQLAQLAESIESQQQTFAAREAEIKKHVSAMEQSRRAIDTERSSLEAREASIAAAQQAIERFEQAFKQIASAFGMKMPDFSEVTAPLMAATSNAADTAVAPLEAAVTEFESAGQLAKTALDEAMRVVAPGNAELTDTAPPAPAIQAAAPPQAKSRGKGADRAAPPAAQPEAGPAADPAILANGEIDELKLDVNTLNKLRVLRRLTGGKQGDAELLQRIRKETAEEADKSGGDKGKKRWW